MLSVVCIWLIITNGIKNSWAKEEKERGLVMLGRPQNYQYMAIRVSADRTWRVKCNLYVLKVFIIWKVSLHKPAIKKKVNRGCDLCLLCKASYFTSATHPFTTHDNLLLHFSVVTSRLAVTPLFSTSIQMESCAQSQDVVVVGGGVAGLAAAERLYQAGLQVGDSFSFPFYPQISLM